MAGQAGRIDDMPVRLGESEIAGSTNLYISLNCSQ